MKNYEAKKPSYFATPSPQLVHALHTSLTQILSKPLSERFQGHIEVSNKVKKAITDLGLKIVATKPEDQAHAMTAIYLPEGVGAPDVLPKLAGKGVVFAGGIHKAIASKYIRFGHMGVSAVSVICDRFLEFVTNLYFHSWILAETTWRRPLMLSRRACSRLATRLRHEK